MQIIKQLPYDILNVIYNYDNTYKIYYSNFVLYDLKFTIYKIKYFINDETKNKLILYKNEIYIHCDNLKNPHFVSTCIFNNKFPIFDSLDSSDKIKNYPEFELQIVSLENKINIIKFIENKYSNTFHPFIEFFSE